MRVPPSAHAARITNRSSQPWRLSGPADPDKAEESQISQDLGEALLVAAHRTPGRRGARVGGSTSELVKHLDVGARLQGPGAYLRDAASPGPAHGGTALRVIEQVGYGRRELLHLGGTGDTASETVGVRRD
jgi:hypothetical protein